jgi:endoglucanase
MKGKLLLLGALAVGVLNAQAQLTGVGDSFDDGVLAETWKSNPKFELFENKNKLQINIKDANANDHFEWKLTNVDVSSNPVLTFKIKTSTKVKVFVELVDAAGKTTTEAFVEDIGDLRTKDVSIDFSKHLGTAGKIVDLKKITKFNFKFKGEEEPLLGIVYFDDIKIGTGGPNNGDTNPFPLSNDIRLNQVGFYTNGQKIAIVKEIGTATEFKLAHLPDYKVVYTGKLSKPANWEYSEENVSVADFSEFKQKGEYVILVDGKGRSFNFKIDQNIFNDVAKASAKLFYFQRTAMPLEAKYAGIWARPAGHPDIHVMVHKSAASTGRPEGSFISSSKGWYDAGDYGKYIVNSGISTFTMLALYEDFPKVYDTLKLDIPEKGNKIPDLLDECLWNVRWMLTMQDPADGGVYHKLTAHNFEGMTLPHEHTAQRLVVGKGTAAALDFAAVMAQSARIFKKFTKELPGLADTCLKAAEKAYEWAQKNPNVEFKNPADVVTGEYGDGVLGDEHIWAANELFVTTKNDKYTVGKPLATSYGIPNWSMVNTLGLYSLNNNKKLAATKYDTNFVKGQILKLADELTKEASIKSAYRVPMGTYFDFVWGSNSVCANEGILLVHAYKMTGKKEYLNAAISALDYLLGRNATNYSFVTGYGSKQVMFPHHRPSAGDKNVDPVPGMLAGGPQNTNNPESGCAYPAELPATKFKDNVCSYSTNEIAINWNAPLVYLAGAIEALMKNK